jgi:membrane protein insertase Oxa1/YidC/SpoIIIJ
MSVFATLIEHLADLLQPLFGAASAAAAIVLFTALVRLLATPSPGPPHADGMPRADALGDGGAFGGAGLVYIGLFAFVAAVAAFNYRRTKLMAAANPAVPVGGGGQVPGLGAVTRIAPFLSFFTLVTVAVVPLAAALYVVTSTTWSAVERAVLYR